jgi:hypothetical protein
VNADLERLIALQAQDARASAAAAALAALPARRGRAEDKVQAARDLLTAQRERLRLLEKARREGEREVEALLAEEKRFQGQTMLVKTNEELWALKREIERVQARRSELETAVLVGMDEEEAGRREAARLERGVADAGAQLEAERAAIENERGRLEDEGLRAQRNREELAVEVPAETRARYERVRSRRGDLAVVPLVRGACGGCLTAQPPQRVQEVRQGEILVVCEFCGRLIVGVEGDPGRPS